MDKFTRVLFKNRQIVHALFIIFFILFLYGNRGFLYSWSYDHNLVPITETFTELYFEDHTNLPDSVVKGEDISFAFIIHNLEGQQMEYEYQVVYESITHGEAVASREELTSKRVLVDDDDLITIDVKVSFAQEVKRGVVYIDLLNKEQSIHFLIN